MATFQITGPTDHPVDITITGNQYYGHSDVWEIRVYGHKVATRRSRWTAELISEEIYSNQELVFHHTDITETYIPPELTEKQIRDRAFDAKVAELMGRMRTLEGNPNDEESIPVTLTCGHRQRLPRYIAEDSLQGHQSICCHICEDHWGAPSYGGYKHSEGGHRRVLTIDC